jgi:hypothetical protein
VAGTYAALWKEQLTRVWILEGMPSGLFLAWRVYFNHLHLNVEKVCRHVDLLGDRTEEVASSLYRKIRFGSHWRFL